MAKHRIIEYLSGYEKDENSTGGAFISKSFSGSLTKSSRSRFASRLSAFFKRFTSMLAYTSVRTYGLFLLGFGLLSLLLHFANDYINNQQVELSVLIIGAVFAIVGIPFLVFDEPLCTAFQHFVITDYIFFEFFGLRRLPKADGARGIHPIFGLILGIIIAVVGNFVHLWIIVVALAAVVFLVLGFTSPEFAFFATFLVMPYLPFSEYGDVILAAIVAVSAVSFIRKVVLGKRVFHLEQYDLLLFIFLIFILISGVFVKGLESFENSLVVLLLSMGYMLASSLLANRRLADGMVNSVVISAVPVSIFSITQAVYLLVTEGTDGFGGVSGSFSSPEELASYLLVAAIFAIYFVSTHKSRGARAIYFSFLALIALALVATLCTWLLVVGLLGALAYSLRNLRRAAPIATAVICLAPYALLFVPASLMSAISELPFFSSLQLGEMSARWGYSMAMLGDNLFFGIGIGSDCFAAEIGSYAGAVSYTDSGNFLLEIALEAGIFALIVLLLIFAVRLRHREAYRIYVKGSSVRHLSDFAGLAIICVFIFGAMGYLWSDMTSNYMFWCLFGTASAVLRVSKREYDDRVGYFSDGRSADASSIDIALG